MLPSAQELDQLTAALLGADQTVVLAGQRLDPEGIAGAAKARDEWTRHADLDILTADPRRFWEHFLPAARSAAARAPSAAHLALVRLQAAGTIAAIVTQASDGLLERAGAHNVVEIYGNVLSVRCERCGERYGLDEAAALVAGSADDIPRCTTTDCAFPLRPAGTLWNETLPRDAVEHAWDLAAECDLLVIIDSDLRTVPISLLPSVPLTRGAGVILIGATPTHYDRYARQVLRVPASAETLTAVADRIAPVRT
jgi:NAD-dependent deacetylase